MSTIFVTVWDNADAIWDSVIIVSRGVPDSKSRPLIFIVNSFVLSFGEIAVPIFFLISSAVFSPINRFLFFRTYSIISKSIWSPAVRTAFEYTMPPNDITATSVVPPPMSNTIEPNGFSTGRPAPMAAAVDSSTMYTLRAPAASAAS